MMHHWSPQRAAGAILFDGGSQSEWTVIGETLMCVHCGKHWMIQPGSGNERGFCLNCMGPTCGGQKCFDCVPMERMLEIMEAKGRVEANIRAIRG